jgi:hypothetical protein
MALAALMWATAIATGWSQTAAPPPASLVETGPPPASPQLGVAPSGAAGAPAPAENPGLLNEMGKALEKSLSILPTLKSPGETLDDLKDAAKNAGEGLSRLTSASVADGRIKCLVAANGAPRACLRTRSKPAQRKC